MGKKAVCSPTAAVDGQPLEAMPDVATPAGCSTSKAEAGGSEFKASLSYVPRTCLIKEKQHKASAKEFWRSQVRRDGACLRVACFDLGLLGNLHSPAVTTAGSCSEAVSTSNTNSASLALENTHALTQGHLGDSTSRSTPGALGAEWAQQSPAEGGICHL